MKFEISEDECLIDAGNQGGFGTDEALKLIDLQASMLWGKLLKLKGFDHDNAKAIILGAVKKHGFIVKAAAYEESFRKKTTIVYSVSKDYIPETELV